MAFGYDADTGFYVDDIEDIREDIAQQFKDAMKSDDDDAVELDTDPETPAGQIVDIITATAAATDSAMLDLANQWNPTKASGVFQDALGYYYFIERKQAQASTAVITCTGLSGTVITKGAKVMSTADDSYWSNDEEGTIGSDGTIDLTFSCDETGAVSAAANTLTKIITVISGWDYCTNNDAASVGNEEETQGAFEDRRYASVAQNARSSYAAVYSRIMSIDDVISCCIRQNRTSKTATIDGITLLPNSIVCFVLGGDDEEVAYAIFNSLSAGCDYNGDVEVECTDETTGAVETVKFYRPGTYNIYIKVTITITDDTPANAEELIKEAVYNNFYGNTETTEDNNAVVRVAPGETLYGSRFVHDIRDAGVETVVSVEVSADGSDYTDYIYIGIDKDPETAYEYISYEEVDGSNSVGTATVGTATVQ